MTVENLRESSETAAGRPTPPADRVDAVAVDRTDGVRHAGGTDGTKGANGADEAEARGLETPRFLGARRRPAALSAGPRVAVPLLLLAAWWYGTASGRIPPDVLAARRRTTVYQEPRLIPARRVLANVTLGLPSAAREAGRRALAEVGLDGYGRAWPATLSGGEAQRVALARALVRDPEVLLLDEPFAALDALTRLQMQELVAELCARHRPAVVLVTHDVDEAVRLADRVVVLRDGALAVDQAIDLPRPRDRDTPGFAGHRRLFLSHLGIAAAHSEGVA
ncbi:ATP-binding cassette domain-containing protein [Sphaerisporangium sp. NPDC051017]|uniref:ABC transporter ATP-binding protein n=1 Tax=Sphaerisporangium sp. NPDC051017 TaxID=3154636 RepID=UPI0034489EAF